MESKVPVDFTAKMLQQAMPVCVQAEVHPKDLPGFEARYRGTEPRGKGPSVFPRSRRGVAVAIYFNGGATVAGNFRALGYEVKEFFNGAYRYCVENEELFWKAVRNGMGTGCHG